LEDATEKEEAFTRFSLNAKLLNCRKEKRLPSPILEIRTNIAPLQEMSQEAREQGGHMWPNTRSTKHEN
jgi:hypothetical protein